MNVAATPASPSVLAGMRADEIGPRIRELEEKCDLLRHCFDGWSIWPLFRMQATSMLIDPKAKPAGRSAPHRVRELFGLAARDLFAWSRAPRDRDVVVVTCSSYRAEQENGRWKDVLFDDCTRELERVYRIERINNRALFERNGTALFPTQMTCSWLSVASFLFLARLPVPAEAIRVAQALARDLGVEPRLRPLTVEHIAQRLAAFRGQRRLWRRLLRRLGARTVLCDDGYYNHDLIAAAHEQGCRVAEFQHGIFAEGGPEYCWSAAAIAHRERMPIPDRVFLFGDVWRELLAKDGFWAERARVVGSARIDHYRRRAGEARRARKDDECHVVVTAQGISEERLAEFLGELLLLDSGWSGLRVTVKLHPSYRSDAGLFHRAFAGDRRGVVVAGNEAPPTFELIAQADFHASISSSCHYDALGLGMRTLVIPLPTHEIMEPLLRAGHAVLAATPAELLAALKERHARPLPEEVSAAYFKPGAVANFRREFAELEVA